MSGKRARENCASNDVEFRGRDAETGDYARMCSVDVGIVLVGLRSLCLRGVWRERCSCASMCEFNINSAQF